MTELFDYFRDTFLTILNMVDWAYMVFLIVTGYVILRSKFFQRKFPKWKTRWVILILGIVFAVLFALVKRYNGIPYQTFSMSYGFVLFFSFVVGQAINLYGIEPFWEKFIAPLLKKIGINLSKKID